jgi:hypothetical protein
MDPEYSTLQHAAVYPLLVSPRAYPPHEALQEASRLCTFGFVFMPVTLSMLPAILFYHRQCGGRPKTILGILITQ